MQKDVFEFKERSVVSVPYTWFGRRLRYVIKWVLILCWVLYSVVVVAILHGDTVVGMVTVLGIPTAVCLSFLRATANGARDVLIDAVYTFTDDSLEAFYDSYPAEDRFGTPRVRQVRYTIKYSDIRKIAFYRRISRVEIYGTVHIEIAEYDSNGQPVQCYDRVRNRAVINSLPVPSSAYGLLDTLCSNAGWQRSYVIEYG